MLKVSPSKMIQVMVMVGEDCDAKYQVTTSVASWSVSRWTTSDCHTRIHLYCTKHWELFIFSYFGDIYIVKAFNCGSGNYSYFVYCIYCKCFYNVCRACVKYIINTIQKLSPTLPSLFISFIIL